MPAHKTGGRPGDLWSTWFIRIVQVAGLLLAVREVAFTRLDRLGVLAVLVAMMLGLEGLRLLVRGARELGGGDDR